MQRTAHVLHGHNLHEQVYKNCRKKTTTSTKWKKGQLSENSFNSKKDQQSNYHHN